MSDKDKMQGEGDKESARNYTESTEEFIESGKVKENVKKAQDASDKEKAEMEKAEKEGKKHSKK